MWQRRSRQPNFILARHFFFSSPKLMKTTDLLESSTCFFPLFLSKWFCPALLIENTTVLPSLGTLQKTAYFVCVPLCICQREREKKMKTLLAIFSGAEMHYSISPRSNIPDHIIRRCRQCLRACARVPASVHRGTFGCVFQISLSLNVCLSFFFFFRRS